MLVTSAASPTNIGASNITTMIRLPSPDIVHIMFYVGQLFWVGRLYG